MSRRSCPLALRSELDQGKQEAVSLLSVRQTPGELCSGPMSSRWTWLNWSSRARWSLTAAFWGILNLLLFLPSQTFRHVSAVLPFQDKVVHLAIFWILTGLIRWSIPNPWGRGWKGGGIMLVLMSYGIGTECLQALIPSLGRSFEWADILVDCIGIVAGMSLCGRLAVPAGLRTESR